MVRNIDDSKQYDGRCLNISRQENIHEPFEEGSENRARVDTGDGSFLCPDSTRRVGEYLHDRWKDNTIPCTLMTENVRYGYFTADTLLETFDDSDDGIYRILVTQPMADHIKASIPVHLRLNNIFAGFYMTPRSPMGVQARIALTAPVIVNGNVVIAPFSRAAVHVERLDGRSFRKRRLTGAPYDGEDTNYRLNRQEGRLFGFDLETLLIIHLVGYGRNFATDIGDVHVTISAGSTIKPDRKGPG